LFFIRVSTNLFTIVYTEHRITVKKSWVNTVILSITEAAKLFGKSRTTLYKYNKNGKLSFVTGDDGKPAVDTNELIRVFGDVHSVRVHEHTDEQDETRKMNSLHEDLQLKIRVLQETLNRQDELLRKADDRELWLRAQLENTQKQVYLLTGPSEQNPKQKKKWWHW